MANSDFRLPDVGEGLTEAEIVQWKVAPGETVTMNQVLVEIETAKSLVELPSPFEGTVSALLVEEGQTVEVGTPIISVETQGAAAEVAPVVVDQAADIIATVEKEPEAKQPTLVGYGAGGHGGSRRRRPAATAAPAAPAATPVAAPRPASVPAAAALPIIAKPPIRKLAKDLGVDLASVTPTGRPARPLATTSSARRSRRPSSRTSRPRSGAMSATRSSPSRACARRSRRPCRRAPSPLRTSASSSTSTRPARWSSSND